MGIVSQVTRLDRSKLAFDVGVRCALGVGATLVAGEASGHVSLGVTAAIGAISGGFASLQGAYRTQAAAVLAASVGMGLAAFVGAMVGHVLVVDVVVTAAVGVAAGLAVCLGQAAAVVGLQTLVGLVVFSQFRFSALVGLREAGLVVAGGVLQVLLVAVLWPLRRFPAERRVLSDAYGRLAGFARELVSDPSRLLAPGAFDPLGQVLRDPQPFGGGANIAAHQALADQAERIRLELAAIGRGRQRLASVAGGVASAEIGEVLAAAGRVLDEVAASLQEARVPTRWARERRDFEAAVGRLRAVPREASLAPFDRAVLDAAATACEALAGQLRAAVRLAAVPAGGDLSALGEAAVTGRPPVRARHGRRRAAAWVRERAATVQANMTVSSEAGRHGIRVGAALAAGVALSHLFDEGHRYWLPLTIMIILKPDFTSTFTRGISRVIGTLVGAGLVTLAVAELRPGPWALTATVVVLFALAIGLLFANYAVYSLLIASLVVTLLAFTGQPEPSLAADRSLYTVVGAAVALVAYAVWPTWVAASLPERLAEVVATEGRYGSAVLAAWADPAAADRGALQQARVAARLARTNTEAAVERWIAEPARVEPVSRQEALGVLAALRAFVQAVLSLHAQLPEKHAAPSGGREELATLAAQVADAFDAAAGTLRGEGHRPLPELRATQLTLRRTLGLDGAGPGGADGPNDEIGPGDAIGLAAPPDRVAVLLAGETDLIVNSANTLGHLVGLERPPAPSDRSG